MKILKKMKKVFFEKIWKNLFIVFLLFYFFTMLEHASGLDMTIQVAIVFLLGLSLAIFSHAKKNYVTIILLVLHMSIEWFEWSQMRFNTTDTILNIGHILMDFVFLSHELTAHVKKHRYKLLFSISLFLIAVFGFSRMFLTGNPQIESVVEIVEPFVIAGVLGCIGSHLFYHLKRFGKKKEEGGECCHEH